DARWVGQVLSAWSWAQIARGAKLGRPRTVRSGEVLVEPGDRGIPFFFGISGELEAVRPTDTIETLLLIVRAGQFTGEINILSGRSAMARVRVRQDGEIVQLARASFLTLVQTDADLSDILMRAFILRRGELLVPGISGATVVGSTHSPATLRL